MRILIIGGTRFIGPHVVRHLYASGCSIAVFHRGRTNALLPQDVPHILGDRRHLSEYATAFERFGPQVVMDMIPTTEQEARAVIATFRGRVERIVSISSQDVYAAYGRLIGIESGPVEPLPFSESTSLRQRLFPYRGSSTRQHDDPQRWMDDYDKILVERALMGAHDMAGTILRLPMVYGPGDAQHRLFPYLKRMIDERPAILLDEGLADWRWTRGYVENVASAIALAGTDGRAAGRVYNVGEVKADSMADWIKRMGDALGWRGRLVILPNDRLPVHLRSEINPAHHLVTDSTRIRAELGYCEHIPLDEALTRTIAWERQHPPDPVDLRQFDYAAEDAVLLGSG